MGTITFHVTDLPNWKLISHQTRTILLLVNIELSITSSDDFIEGWYVVILLCLEKNLVISFILTHLLLISEY